MFKFLERLFAFLRLVFSNDDKKNKNDKLLVTSFVDTFLFREKFVLAEPFFQQYFHTIICQTVEIVHNCQKYFFHYL